MTANPVPLPFELYECIVSHVYALPPGDGWRSTLKACASVSKEFKYISYPYLFKFVTFVFVDNLDNEAGLRHEAQKRRDRSFYRFVTSMEDIGSYFAESSTIPSCIRSLSLRANHLQAELNSELPCFSYGEFVQTLKPLKNLHKLSLWAVSVDTNSCDVRPILPGLPELFIDFSYDSVQLASTTCTCLYSICALFGEITHLTLDRIPWDGNSPIDGVVCPPVRAVTIVTGILASENPFRILEYIPAHYLRALHLPDLCADDTSSLSHLLEYLGPSLEFLTLGKFHYGDDILWYTDHDEFPSIIAPVNFNASVNMHSIVLNIEIPPVGEKYFPRDAGGRHPQEISYMQGLQHVIFQSLPPSVKTLKLSLECWWYKQPYIAEHRRTEIFWEVFVQSLVRSVNGGVERIELTMATPSDLTVSCTEDEQVILRSYFPSLVDGNVLAFP